MSAAWDDQPDAESLLALLLEAGANVDMRNQFKISLLMHSMGTNTAAVRKVLEYRPDPDARDCDDNTIFTMMTGKTSVETVKLLLRYGGRLDVINKSRRTPLIQALSAGNLDVAKFLLTKDTAKSTVNTPSTYGTPLHHACSNDNPEAVHLLADNGANVDYAMSTIGTPIMGALLDRSEDCAKALLARRAQTHYPTGVWSFPIILASFRLETVDLARMLLQSGVPNNVSDSFGRRPAHVACYHSLGMLDELKLPHQDFAVRDHTGRYPLHYACLSGDVALVEEVIERSKRVGVDVDARDNDGWTGLLWAARSLSKWMSRRRDITTEGKLDVIKLLISRGADTGARGKGLEVDEKLADDRWTAAEIARYHQADDSIQKMFEESTPRSLRTGNLIIGDEGTVYCDCCGVVSSPVLPSPPSWRTCTDSIESRETRHADNSQFVYGIYFTCAECTPNIDLCVKCARYRSTLHPNHNMVQLGSVSSPQLKTEHQKPETSHPVNDDVSILNEEESPYDYEDEIRDLAAAMPSDPGEHVDEAV